MRCALLRDNLAVIGTAENDLGGLGRGVDPGDQHVITSYLANFLENTVIR
jgi:hypothetical protein